MSNPGTSTKPFALTSNPAVNGLILKGLTTLSGIIAGVILTWLNAHGFNDPNLTLMLSGAVLSVLSMVAVAIWGFVQTKISQAMAVNAGMNLVVSGNAKMQDAGTGDGSLTPVPATTATAPEIVKYFAPVTVTTAPLPPIN